MAEINSLNAAYRNKIGTNKSKQYRKEGKLPAIIYGDGKNPEPVLLDIHELRKEITKSAFTNKVYDISLEDKKVRVLVQDIKQNPLTERLEHVDFLRVNSKTKVTIEVPVSFINQEQSPGIKRGGVLNIVRHTVEISCPVDKIPEKFEFDLTSLEIGDSIHISHTKIEEGVETSIKDRDFTVASILAPSVSSADTDAEETDAEETDAEGEKEAAETEVKEEDKK